MNDYEDIINLKHYNPKFHSRMSIYNRSAQFAPFAALTGYDEAIVETSRIIDNEVELYEDLRNMIDIKLHIVEEHINSSQEINVLYFEKDNRKKGGKYIEHKGIVKRLDVDEQLIIFFFFFKIKFETILDIKAQFISDL